MDYKMKHKFKKFLFGLIGLVIIPLYALLFSRNGPNGDLVLVTFSQIGSRYGSIEGLILWGIITSLYYFTFLSYLFDISGSNGFVLRFMLGVTCLSLLVAVFLPFSPSMFPIAASTHNYLAYLTAISTIVTMFLFVFSLFNIDRDLFYKSITLLLFLSVLLLTVFLRFGVSSLFQIVLSTTLCTFLFIELCLLEKSKSIDIYQHIKNNIQIKTLDGDEFFF